MSRSRLDAKPMPLQRRAQVLIGSGFLRVDPDDQNACGTEIVDEPIKRRFERLERALAPVDEGYAVLSSGVATICRGRRAEIAAPLQH